MQTKKNLLISLAGTTITTGIALATHGSSSLVFAVANGIAGNLAASFLEKTEFRKLNQLIKNSNPSDLNHDLKKLVIKATEWAIKNIEIVYNEKLTSVNHKEEFNAFIKILLDDVSLLHYKMQQNDTSLMSDIESANLINALDLDPSSYPIISEELPFNTFFSDKFKDHFQLCFGELLKKDERAYIAYQRVVYKTLNEGIETVMKQNDDILNKLDDLTNQKIKYDQLQWSQLSEKAKAINLDSITIPFNISFEDYFAKIEANTTLLVDLSTEILSDVKDVKEISGAFMKELKRNWYSKNKLLILLVSVVAILVISSLVYSNFTQPFAISVALQKDKSINIHSGYPTKLTDEAILLFDFPSGINDKAIGLNHNITISEISSELLHDYISVKLIDKYWELTSDSLQLKEGLVNLAIRPNSYMSTIRGKVFDPNANKSPLENVTISLGSSLITTTDKQGEFLLEIPLSLRRIDYMIHIRKAGYLATNLEVYGGPEHLKIPIKQNIP